MGISSRALFLHLASDLSRALPSVSWDLISDESRKIEPWPGITVREYAALALRSSIFKKFEGVKASDADSLALHKFLESNIICNRLESTDKADISEIETICLGEFREAVYSFFYTDGDTPLLNCESITEGFGVGPGASIGATGESFYHKVAASPFTGTNESLLPIYKRESAKYSLELETENLRSSFYGDLKLVPGNKLSFVPKTSEISRTICTEPLLNMLFQKGIGAVLEKQLVRRFGIDLSIQPKKNQALARLGSEDGSFGTIDLSSASDSISLALMRDYVPRDSLSWFMLARSPSVTLPSGSVLPLHMVSSMGNAFTFPLQTILFACVVIGVYNAIGITPIFPKGRRLGNFAVFGDDIIVRRKAYALVCSILKRIGFRVNSDKSFNEGPFRESCGSDFLSGVNVRGVYCRKLDSLQDRYSLINRLQVWSSNHDILLTDSIGYLMETVKFLPVPPWESDVAGVKVPFHLASGLKRSKRFQGSVLYLRYQPKAAKLSLLAIGERPHISRRVRHNPPGVLLSAVRGYLKDGQISFRLRSVFYKLRPAVAPCWDHDDPSLSNFTREGWRRWVTIYAALVLGRS